MKIAFLSFNSGEMYRGVETFVHEVANRLTDMGNEVTVYQNGQKLPGARYKTVSISLKVNWEKRNSYIPFFNYYGRLVGKFTLKVLKKLDKDTDILFPTNGQWQSLLSSLWTTLKKTKLVISGQSGPGLDDRINIWTFPDIFLGLTDKQVKWAKNANPFVKVGKIPNGVDLKKFNKSGLALEVDLPRPIILCVAAFDTWKRLDLAIKAVARLKKGSLLLVGRGSCEKALRKMGEKLLPGRFKIMSFPHKDMPKVYKAADLFTYPTAPWESFGIVLVEAMASGLPVVATKDPIRREIVGRAGFFVNPKKTARYASAIREALGKKWGDIPRIQAGKYDWNKIAKLYESLFKSLIK